MFSNPQRNDQDPAARCIKVLFMGVPKVSKTGQGIKMPPPLGVVDVGDGALPFHHSRGGEYDFGIRRAATIEEVNVFARDLLDNQKALDDIRTVMFDDMTAAWRSAQARLRIGKAAAPQAGEKEGSFADQAALKAPWATFASLVKEFGVRGKNVVVTAEAKPRWADAGRKPKMTGYKLDADDKILGAFDLVFLIELNERTGRAQATVVETRYPAAFPKGSVIENFDSVKHFAPLLGSWSPSLAKPEFQESEEAAALRATLGEALRSLGSKQRGGKVPTDDARRFYWLTQDPEAGREDFVDALRELARWGWKGKVPSEAAA